MDLKKYQKNHYGQKLKKIFKRSKPIMNHNYIIIDGFVEDTIDEFEKKNNFNNFEIFFFKFIF